MRTHLMLTLAGLLILTGSARAAEKWTTQDVTEYYRDTWLASDEEKSRCATLLQQLAGNDIEKAKKQGNSIDNAMRDQHCLDGYSYVYAASTPPEDEPTKKLDKASVELIGTYLFIYINTFQNSGDDLLAEIRRLDNRVLDSAKTVVFDVRGNTGGYVETLRKLLDLMFAPKAGMRFLELSGKASYGTFFTTSQTGVFVGRDIRILADSQTGSSSEWMIETLCYEWYPEKCTTLGSPTYGKSILQCISSNKGIEVKLTCGEWFVADKHPTKDQSKLPQRIQGIGITPDKPMTFADCDRFAYKCIAQKLADAGL